MTIPDEPVRDAPEHAHRTTTFAQGWAAPIDLLFVVKERFFPVLGARGPAVARLGVGVF